MNYISNVPFNDTKSHYQILDGLRGVAQVMVVAFHILETFTGGDHAKQIVNHGYLPLTFSLSLEPAQLRIGFTRLLYPFFAGLLLSRVVKPGRIKHAFVVNIHNFIQLLFRNTRKRGIQRRIGFQL